MIKREMMGKGEMHGGYTRCGLQDVSRASKLFKNVNFRNCWLNERPFTLYTTNKIKKKKNILFWK